MWICDSPLLLKKREIYAKPQQTKDLLESSGWVLSEAWVIFD